MKIDFSKFKKIGCDDNCTVLEHEKGHQIKIAHKGLKEEFRKELDDLPIHKAKGGPLKGPFSAGSSEEHGGGRGTKKGGNFSQFSSKLVKDRNSKPSQPSKPLPPASYTPPKQASKAYTEPDNLGTTDHKDVMLDFIQKGMHREAPPFGPMGPIGTLPEETHHYPPCINPSCKSFGHSHPNCHCYGGKFHAKGGEIEQEEFYCSSERPHKEGCEYFKEGGMAGEDPEELIQETQPQAFPGETPSPQAIPESTPSPSMSPQATPEPAPVPADQDWKGSYGVVNPNAEMGQAPKEAPQQTLAPKTPVQKYQDVKLQTAHELTTESQAFNNDLNMGHIKPETYHDLFDKKSTLGKIGTIFGLLIGGAGAGLAHQPNMLLEMMNKEIDRDLQAQEHSAANRQNFLKINQQRIMNESQIKNIDQETKTKAYALTRMQMNNAALHKLASDVNKLPVGSAQRQQAEQTLAMLYQGVQGENFNIMDRAAAGAAFYKTILGNQGQGGTQQDEGQFQQRVKGMKMLGPDAQKQAEDLETKHYPGIPGQASAPLTSDDRTQIHSGVAFDRALHAFKDWTKNHSGDLNPKDIKYGKALAADLQGAYRLATHGGVYKEGEQNFISQLIDSNPTKFFNSIRVVPQLEALSDSNKLRLDQLLKDKGFQGYPGHKPTTGNSGGDMKTVNGVTYKKGPNGEAIKVHQ